MKHLSRWSFLIVALSVSAAAVPPRLQPVALPAIVDNRPLPSLAPMLEKVTPAVVNISTTTLEQESPLLSDPFFRHFFNMPSRPTLRKNQSLGSGVIIDAAQGHVLTNHHVIDKAHAITVTLQNGRELTATLLGDDADTDVALLKIDSQDLTALPLADSDQLRVGDFVLAIGSPFGLKQTVTSGIVSALGRTGLGIEGYEDFIQTDASINPGNSGGPLVNLRGELVGINTAILAPGGGNVGIGFAIPINMVKKIADHLAAHGEVQRGVLGIETQDITPELAAAFQLDNPQGAVVARVQPDSAAAAAGMQAGDIITQLDGKPVHNSADVRTRIGLLRIGDKLDIRVLRDNRELRLTARIAEPGDLQGQSLSDLLAGATFHEIKLDTRQGTVTRVAVHQVKRNSAAWEAGLRPDDVILALNRLDIARLDEMQAVFAQQPRSLLLSLLRDDSVLTLLLR